MRRWFTALIAAEWQVVFDWKWNFKIPLLFSHVVLTRTISSFKAREIQERIYRRLDLWERGIHTGMVEGVLAEGQGQGGSCQAKR